MFFHCNLGSSNITKCMLELFSSLFDRKVGRVNNFKNQLTIGGNKSN